MLQKYNYFLLRSILQKSTALLQLTGYLTCGIRQTNAAQSARFVAAKIKDPAASNGYQA